MAHCGLLRGNKCPCCRCCCCCETEEEEEEDSIEKRSHFDYLYL